MDQYDFDSLKARVAELEDRLKLIYRRLNIEYVEGEPGAIHPKIREALLKGNKIEAIKVYRELYKVGLAEAKQAIDAMEQGVN